MDWIDAHTHAYPADDLALVVERVAALDGHLSPEDPCKWQLVNGGSVEDLAAAEEAAGFDRFVLLPISGRPDGSSRINRWAAEQAAHYPQIIPFGSLTPLSDTPEEDLRELLALGLRGLKLHSVLQRIIPVEQRTLDWLELIQTARLPVVMDSMNLAGLRRAKPHMKPLLDHWAPFETSPDQIALLARTFPGINFIAAHLGCLYGWDGLDPLFPLDNVYFDLSYALEILPPEEIRAIIARKRADHILYGSDTPWRDPAGSWGKVLALHLSDGDLDKIAGENLLQLLE